MADTGQSATERLNSALADRYRIESEIGKGGMATVYLAADLRHNRKVALKVLNPELSAVVGSERFLAEIQTTAHLQHPHILPLYDSGEADGWLFYVMPYIEGESLRARLDREKQLPVDLAVTITRQVAAALGYAHQEGIIHRDIKPANILVHQGEALVADFGIALAVTAAGGTRLTDTGLSLGTPEYMSPEQAAGDRALDAKSDIYSLGCVAYEMFVGEPPHTGPTTQAIIAKIITDEPQSIGARRKSIPRNVDGAVRRALEKLPADRFESADAFARALADEHFRHGESAASGAVDQKDRLWNRVAIAMTAIAATAVVALVWSLLRSEPLPVVRSTLTFSEAQGLWSGALGVNIALSPDGSMLVYRGASQLWQRRLSELEPEPIPGTEGAINPVISPDGTSLAFVVQGSRSLKTISLAGAPPFTVVPSGVWDGPGGGIDWGSDGMLYFTNDDGAIQSVPSTGGEVTAVTTNEAGTRHAWVDALPDGRGLLFSITRGLPEQSEIAVLGFDDDQVNLLIRGAMARYATSGHIVYAAADGTLLVAPFSADRRVVGGTVQLPESVDVFPGSEAQFAFSESGSLLYVPSGGAYELFPVWADRSGATEEIHAGWRVQGDPVWTSVVLSPDGGRLAISKRDSEGTFDLWVKQLDTGPELQLTFEGTLNYRPVWSDDGRTLTFVSNRAGERDVWSKRADGSSTAELVLDREQQIFEVLYAPENAWLVFREGGYSAGDILGIQVGADTVAVPLVATESQEREIALSPDGRWLAYVSNRSGRDEVYVRPFPDAKTAMWPVSNDGGTEPVWAHSGLELFYRNGASELVAARVSGNPSFAVGHQEVLFSMAGYMYGNGRPQYDVRPDDQRFVLLRIGAGVATDPILVQNYFEELRAKAPN